jgi:CHAD domain-containing protein
MEAQSYFKIPAGWTPNELVYRMHKDFSLQPQPVRYRVITYYDSFDWRLHFGGRILFWDRERLYLVQQGPRRDELSSPYDLEPGFVQDLPESLLRTRLTELIDVRALLPVVTLKKEIQPFKFFDREKKTVCLGDYEKICILRDRGFKRLPPLFSVTALRGYSGWAARLSEWLQDHNFLRMEEDLYDRVLQKIQLTAGWYTSKAIPDILPDFTVEKALHSILRQQIDIMIVNEDGIRKDTDSEFLHDFRVAVRRIRSLCGCLSDYLDRRVYTRVRTDFPALIRLTNSRRDLDVFLRKENTYMQQAPRRYRAALAEFFTKLKIQRSREQNKILRYLSADPYVRIKIYWLRSYRTKPLRLTAARFSAVGVQQVAGEAILKRYGKICRLNRKLPVEQGDEVMHRVRIGCKKLRYALEFFLPLFDQQSARSLIKKLRFLQDTLGEYNDLSLQQRRCTAYLNHQSPRFAEAGIKRSAIRYVIRDMQKRKNELRVVFKEQFTEFCMPKMQQSMESIFRSPVKK